MRCPSCTAELRQAGRTYKCDACDGAWVQAEVLVPLLEQSASHIVDTPWRPNTEAHVRPCPECAQSMATVKLGTVALDRCEAHGVWFDAKELAALLKQARSFRTHDEASHDGLIDRISKLFRGD